MRRGQRRRVVEPVADHQHAAALRLQRLDERDLLGRLETGTPVRDAERGGDRRHRIGAVAREDRQIEAKRREPPHRPPIASGRNVWLTANTALPVAMAESDRAMCPHRAHGDLDAGRCRRTPTLPSRASIPSIERTHALARLLDRAVERRALARFARDRRRQRMAARQAQAAPRIRARPDRHIGAHCATRGSGSVSVPVLSKTTVSTSASRSMASPELRIRPARNSAPDATTCTAGIASASAQGQVMISTAIAVTIASCSEAPGAQPAGRGQRRGRMHHRRVEARRAIGQADDSAICAVDRLVEQPLDLVDQRAGAGGGHPHGQSAGEVHAAGIDRGAGGDGARARSRR